MRQPTSTETYGMTVGAVAQLILQVLEKMIGPATIIYRMLQASPLSMLEEIEDSLLIALFCCAIPAGITQLTLVYTKSKHENNAEHKQDSLLIRPLMFFPKVGKLLTYLASMAEGLTAAAALIQFTLKVGNINIRGNNKIHNLFPTWFNWTLLLVPALFIFFSRYQKINFVDSQEVRHEFKKRANEDDSENTFPSCLNNTVYKKIASIPSTCLSPLYNNNTCHKITSTLSSGLFFLYYNAINYFSYQISPTIDNSLVALGPFMFYNDLSESIPALNNYAFLAFCVFLSLICSYGEYCAQLQDSKWYRDNIYKTGLKEAAKKWTHHPYWLGPILLNIATLPGRFAAAYFPTADPATWNYNGIKTSKTLGFMMLMGIAPIELYKVITNNESAVLSDAIGVEWTLVVTGVAMILGMLAGLAQCYARDTGLRNIAANLTYNLLGITQSTLDIPRPDGYHEYLPLTILKPERKNPDDPQSIVRTGGVIARDMYCLYTPSAA